MTENYKVYIKVSTNSLVTAIDSEWNISDLTGWTYLSQGNNPHDKYYHAQCNYLDKPLYDENGCHNYKYTNGVVSETSDAEKTTELASFPEPEPTVEEKLASQQEQLDDIFVTLVEEEV